MSIRGVLAVPKEIKPKNPDGCFSPPYGIPVRGEQECTKSSIPKFVTSIFRLHSSAHSTKKIPQSGPMLSALRHGRRRHVGTEQYLRIFIRLASFLWWTDSRLPQIPISSSRSFCSELRARRESRTSLVSTQRLEAWTSPHHRMHARCVFLSDAPKPNLRVHSPAAARSVRGRSVSSRPAVD